MSYLEHQNLTQYSCFESMMNNTNCDNIIAIRYGYVFINIDQNMVYHAKNRCEFTHIQKLLREKNRD